MVKFLIFAGTTEGRRLIETLIQADSREQETQVGSVEGERSGGERKRLDITACVATDYGRNVLEESVAAMERDGLHILSGRRSEEDMVSMMTEHRYDAVIDATHPYAVAASACIRGACERTGTQYLRLLRESGVEALQTAGKGVEKVTEKAAGKGAGKNGAGEAVFVESTEEAVRFLSTTEGPILLTTGSKELAAYTKLEGYRQRVFARVLPMTDVVAHCTELGFQGRQLICMQGPFSYEMNVAMLKQTGARYLVTKDSGKAGGFDEKLLAAEDLKVCPVIIGRKPEKDGESRTQVLAGLEALCGLPLTAAEQESRRCERKAAEPLDWFPVFINLRGKYVTVVGAGKIAARRIKTLLSFSCYITVIAEEAAPHVEKAAADGLLKLKKKAYETSDLFDPEEGCAADYVLAATNDRSCNHKIYCDCGVRGIPVNVADCKEENDFYFPGVASSGQVVVGITAGGRNHTLARVVSAEIRRVLNRLEFQPGQGDR